jgi:4-amino-4-deoxy-L-arabinose transferase-like glycosyltransferase
MTGQGRRVAMIVAGLLLLGLLLRIGVVLDSRPYELLGDAYDYRRHALSIANRLEYPRSLDGPDGGPTAFRPPLYPIFLAPFYEIGGRDATDAVRLAQAGLGVLVAALIGLIAWRLWGRRVGLVALGLASLFPPFMFTGAAVLSETLFLALLLGACAAALEARRSAHRLRWAVAAGVLCGLVALTRSNGAVLIVPLAFALFGPRERGWRLGLLPVAALVGAAALTVAPWTVRNAIVLDSFVPVSTQGGHTLAGAFNETVRRADAEWAPPWALPDFAHLYWRPRFRRLALAKPEPPGGTPREWRTDLPEPELDRKLSSAARDHMLDHPLYVLDRIGSNTVELFQLKGPRKAHISPEETALHAPWPRRAATYGFYPVLVLALLGAFTAQARRAPRWLWLVPVLFLPVVLIHAFIRFRAPIDAFLIMLAAIALVALGDRVRARARRTTAAES